jgi:autotransporter passenger strand-loop-strand repeat protein
MATTSVTSGQTFSGLTLNNGDLEYVLSGGTSSATTITSGGIEYVYSGGNDFGTVLSSPGGSPAVEVLSGGIASGTTVDLNGRLTNSGGTASGITVSAGGIFYEDDGTASDTTVNSGGYLVQGSPGTGGTTSGTTINAGGRVNQYAGTASGTTVNSGGEYYMAGGTASGTIVNGGYEILTGGGSPPATENGATVESGGILEVDYTGTANGTIVGNGGKEVLYGPVGTSPGGIANGTIVGSGGQEVVAGGITSNTTISGGTLELTGDGSAAGAITFAGSGGVLKIDGTTMPTNAINGFAPGDTFDLAGVAYSSTGTVTVKAGNVLQIVEGGVTYNLQLDLSQNYSEDSFALSSDGSGGTKVTMTVPSGAETTEAPSLTVPSSLSVSPGGSIPMGITATPVDSDDTVSIAIKRVPSYEKITAGPGETVTTNTAKGSTTYTITSTTPGATITDLTLTSTYNKNKVVKNKFTVTASNTTSGESGKKATSLSKTVTVTDPPILATNESIQGAASQETIGRQLLGGAPPTNPPGLDHVVVGAHTTLGYSGDSGDVGGTLPDRDGTHGAKLANGYEFCHRSRRPRRHADR